MKRAIKKNLILILIFSTIIFLQVHSKSPTKKRISKLDHNQIFQFSITFKEVCQKEIFFTNLKKHRSYPTFGEIKDWKKKCQELMNISNSDDIKDYLIKNFRFEIIKNSVGLLTGYYEPIIRVAKNKNEKYRFPILKKNGIYKKKSRDFIQNNFDSKDVLLWTDDIIDLFFLHIQGSGIGEFKNKKKIKIVYDGNNDLSYTSIGKILVKKNYIKKKNVDLFTIKEWLRKNTALSETIMNQNKRFIFFKTETQFINSSAIGAFGLPLKPYYSIAVDKNIYPLGLPFVIEDIENNSVLPVTSLDTGAAIVGSNRADLFTGRGKDAEKTAGVLKKKIYLHAIIPYSN